MEKTYTLRDLPTSERPRERLAKFGSEALSAQEILALILGMGTKGEPVMVIAQTLLSHFGDLQRLSCASLEELSSIKGIGTAKASQLKAVFEISRRLQSQPEAGEKPYIKSPQDAFKEIQSELRGKKKEYFVVLTLDTRKRLIGKETVSMGSLNSSIVHPREAFKQACIASAASVVFAHNHPSGDPEPSDDDIELTRRLKQSGEIMGIDVLDHIIVGNKNFVSLKERNIL